MEGGEADKGVMSEEVRMMNVDPKKPDIVERTVAFSLRIIRLYRSLAKDQLGRIIGQQLLRSGTSIGANVHEAQGAQTKADFNAKMYIAYKEVRETAYWLRLVREAELAEGKQLSDILDETNQLIKILSSILMTSKQNMALK